MSDNIFDRALEVMATEHQQSWHGLIAADIKNSMQHLPELDSKQHDPMGNCDIVTEHFRTNTPGIVAIAEDLANTPNVGMVGNIMLYDLEQQRKLSIVWHWGSHIDYWTGNRLQMTNPTAKDYVDPKTDQGQHITAEMTSLKAKFGIT